MIQFHHDHLKIYRYLDFTFVMQFIGGDIINLADDQECFDQFHISFIIYDLDEDELLLTSTQDVDFKKLGETLLRKNNKLFHFLSSLVILSSSSNK